MAKRKSAATNEKTTQTQGEIPAVQNGTALSPRRNGQRSGNRTTGQERGDLSESEFNARVARKAFTLFQGRGGDPGRDVEDWLEAERQVKEEIRRERES